MNLKAIIVCETRSAIATVLNSALQLCKDAHALAQATVRMKQISLQPVTVVVLRASSESELAEILVPPSRFTSNGYVPSVIIKRNVLDAVERIGTPLRISQSAPVFVITLLLIRRR